jgi:hypothetical protein
MKILSKFFISIILMNAGMAQAFPSGYTIADWWLRAGRFARVFGSLALHARQMVQYASSIKRSPDAPEVIINFCREKLKKHGLNPEQIQIKVKDDCSFLEVSGNNIVFAPVIANEFKNALDNPSDAQLINTVKIYSTFLDHEIAHLKNNDDFKNQVFLVGASVLSYAAITGFMCLPYINSFFKKPTNKRELIKSLVAYALANVGTSFLVTMSHSVLYTRYHENRADEYAISHAQDPEALRCAATTLEMCDNPMVEFLCGSNLNWNPNISTTQRELMMCIRSIIIDQHRALKTDEDFRSWIKQRPELLYLIKFIYDPGHPSGFDRAKKMRAAADVLEAKQKITTELPELAQAA